MAITLGAAKQFAVEEASQHISGASATRKVMRWIQGALLRLHGTREWKHFITNVRINLDPEETGVGLAATQGSGAISRTPTAWAAKYVTEFWDLLADDDPTVSYRLASIGTPTTNATLDTGQAWLAENLAAGDHTLTRWRYPLSARKIYVVEVLPQQWAIPYVLPAEIDRRRNNYPNTRHSAPEVFTLRGNYLEIWPALGTTRRALSVTYQRLVTLPEDDDVDAFELDWPDNYLEALRAAIVLEASRQLGEAAKVPLSSALLNYREALGRCETQDAQLGERITSMGLVMEDDLPRGRAGRLSDLSPLPEE